MASSQQGRREALKIIGAISGTCAFPYAADELYGQEAHHGEALIGPNPSKPPKPLFFDAAEFAYVSHLSDLIIPRTETPGAIDVGVPLYIDYVVSSSKEFQKLFRGGLARLDAESRSAHGKPFLQLTEAGQTAMLQRWEAADENTEQGRFFRALKGMTADGYYTSEPGMVKELGYRVTVHSKFAGHCVPEH